MNSSPPPNPRRNADRSPTPTHSRPLGVTIICVLGCIGFVLAFIPIFYLLGLGGIGSALGLVLLALNVAMLVVLVGLWNMDARVLPWALLLYGIGLLSDLVTFNLFGVVISLIIISYLISVRHEFSYSSHCKSVHT